MTRRLLVTAAVAALAALAAAFGFISPETLDAILTSLGLATGVAP